MLLLLSMQTSLSPCEPLAIFKINFHQKFNVLLRVAERYQAASADTDFRALARELDLETSLCMLPEYMR